LACRASELAEECPRHEARQRAQRRSPGCGGRKAIDAPLPALLELIDFIESACAVISDRFRQTRAAAAISSWRSVRMDRPLSSFRDVGIREVDASLQCAHHGASA
jgi:hypothetical protein